MARTTAPIVTIPRTKAIEALKARIAAMQAGKAAEQAALDAAKAAKAKWREEMTALIIAQLAAGEIGVRRIDTTHLNRPYNDSLELTVACPKEFVLAPTPAYISSDTRWDTSDIERVVRILELSTDENVSTEMCSNIARYV